MTGSAYSWEDLAAHAAGRQFPQPQPGRTAGQLAALIGPIQSQTARSPFIGMAARMPGITHADLTTAYESHDIVRGSTLRGTVHTTTPTHHATLDAVTRIGQRALWQRTLKLERTTLEQVWAGIESYATDTWRTPDDLSARLANWLADNESPSSAARLENAAGRYFAFGHGGLVRRPLKGGWEGQGLSGYRAASTVLGPTRPRLPQPDEAVDAAVLIHIRAHGPSSRHDLAWWAGIGLRVIDASLDRLGPSLISRPGPDGRAYLDLADARTLPPPIDPGSLGIRLLPEFDALLCGYEPAGRLRFIDPEHHRLLWSQSNGLSLAPVLRNGRLSGFWRLTGTGRTRDLDLAWFAGTGRPSKNAYAEAIAALATGLNVSIGTVTLTRA